MIDCSLRFKVLKNQRMLKILNFSATHYLGLVAHLTESLAVPSREIDVGLCVLLGVDLTAPPDLLDDAIFAKVAWGRWEGKKPYPPTSGKVRPRG